MKPMLNIFLMLTVLFFAACKESDNDGFSLITADGKTDVNTEGNTTSEYSANEVILYDQGLMHSGTLGGRNGVNNLCLNSSQKPDNRMKYIGFISIDSVDKIGDLPKNNYFPGDVPVMSVTGKTLANDWGDLMDGSINDTLQNLDVITTSENWWSGKRTGALLIDTCNGFISDSSGDAGFTGISDATQDTKWIENAGMNCSIANRILCLAY